MTVYFTFAPVCLLALGVVGWILVRDKRTKRRVVAKTSSGVDAITPAATKTQREPGRLAQKLGPTVGKLAPKPYVNWIRRTIDSAGNPSDLTLERFFQRKSLLALLGSALFLTNPGLGGTLYLIVPAIAQDARLAGQARRRQQQVSEQLPDFLTLLALAVGAGAGLNDAIQRVAARMQGPLAEEMMRTLDAVSLGQDRRTAFRSLLDRNRSDQLRRFVIDFVHAEQLGTPLAPALETLAIDNRSEGYTNEIRRAASLAPRMSALTASVLGLPTLVLIVTSFASALSFSFGAFG